VRNRAWPEANPTSRSVASTHQGGCRQQSSSKWILYACIGCPRLAYPACHIYIISRRKDRLIALRLPFRPYLAQLTEPSSRRNVAWTPKPTPRARLVHLTNSAWRSARKFYILSLSPL